MDGRDFTDPSRIEANRSEKSLADALPSVELHDATSWVAAAITDDRLVERGDDGKERVLVDLPAADGKRLRAAAALALGAHAAATAEPAKKPTR
jgi:ribosomal 50S subunit-associated protein YjgA (DUF615 family)